MTQIVEVGGKEFEFPDNASPEQIKAALDRHLGAPPIPTPREVQGALGKPGGQRMPFEKPGTGETLAGLTMAAGQGMSYGFGDELAAGAESLLTGKPYGEAVDSTREAYSAVPTSSKLVGEVAGSLPLAWAMPYSPLANAKPNLLSMMGRGAAEGGMVGGLYGAGHAEGGGRVGGALKGMLGGALFGAGTGALMRAFAGRQPRPTPEDLKKAGSTLYKQIENAGVKVKNKPLADLVDDMSAWAEKQGIRSGLFPKAKQALEFLKSEAGMGKNFSMDDLLTFRRVLKAAAKSDDETERMIAMKLTETFDDWFAKAPADLNRKWTSARLAWSRFRKADTVEDMIENAGLQAKQFTGSGYENALRTQFRTLAKNPERMRLFTEAEQAAIRKIAKGGLIGNFFRALGRFAARGPVSAGMTGGIGHVLGGPGGAATAVGVGEAGRQLATRSTLSNVDDLLYRIMTGKAPVTLSSQQATALRSLLLAEQAGTPNLLEVMN